jgi:hypothetical protein
MQHHGVEGNFVTVRYAVDAMWNQEPVDATQFASCVYSSPPSHTDDRKEKMLADVPMPCHALQRLYPSNPSELSLSCNTP